MRSPQLPFDPMRKGLYTARELLKGFDAHDAGTLAGALDYRIYRYWVMQGRYKPNYFDGMMQSLHDNAISQGVADLVKGRRVAAIMGGHAMARDSEPYRNVAILSWRLARTGLLVASGGGPGAMEAVHLGALHAQSDDEALHDALMFLAATPAFPVRAGTLVARNGSFDAEVLGDLVRWLSPALAIVARLGNPGLSLGVPTWRYGHEPTSVFATHIAKYFENSVREDGLLTLATHGVVYAQGGAGTLQEVFQDAVFNAYADEDRKPNPMIFLGTQFWARMGVLPVLRELFGPEGFDAYVTATDDIDQVVDTLTTFDPNAPKLLIQPGLSGPARSRSELRLDRLEPTGGANWPI